MCCFAQVPVRKKCWRRKDTRVYVWHVVRESQPAIRVQQWLLEYSNRHIFIRAIFFLVPYNLPARWRDLGIRLRSSNLSVVACIFLKKLWIWRIIRTVTIPYLDRKMRLLILAVWRKGEVQRINSSFTRFKLIIFIYLFLFKLLVTTFYYL